MLDDYQPSVSNLLKERNSQVSIEKLLRYADRLHLETSIAVPPLEAWARHTKSRAGSMHALPPEEWPLQANLPQAYGQEGADRYVFWLSRKATA